MSHPPSIPPADPSATTPDIAQRDSHQLRHGRLGVFAVAFFVISAAAPLTAMAGGAPVAMLLGNGPGDSSGVGCGQPDLADLRGRLYRDGAPPHQYRSLL